MAINTGFEGGVAGFGEESVWGTYDTVDNFIRMINESIDKNYTPIHTAGLPGIYMDDDDYEQGNIAVAGDINVEIRYEGYELLFEHAMGAVASTEDSTFTIVLSTNDDIVFKEDGGGNLTATIAPGSYAMGETSATAGTLCEAIKTALEAAGSGTYTITFSNTTKKLTISVGGAIAAVQYINSGSTAGSTIGFTADSSNAASIVADTAVVPVFTHIYTLTDELQQGKGLSFEIDMDNEMKKVEGAKVNMMSMNVAPDGLLLGTFGIIAEDLDIETTTPTSPTLTTGKFVVFDQAAITYNAVATSIKNLTFSLNNNMSTDRYFLGSRLIREPQRTARIEVTGSFSMEFEDDEKYNDFAAATTRALIATFTGDEMKSGSNYTLTITMPKIRVTNAVPKLTEAGVINYDIAFKAYATDSSTREMTMALKNTKSVVA